MFASLDLFKTAQAMAVHAGQRQALVAENLAHANTPGYRARDLPDFSESFSDTSMQTGQKATREGHLFGHAGASDAQPIEIQAESSGNGNSVSIEEQMVQAVEVKRQHDRALAIYRSSLTVLRSALGRL